MKWFSHVLAWILLVGLIAFAPTLQLQLPNTSEGMATDAYKQWAGVLRIWVNLGWKPGNGTLTPWLNEVCARFERAHPGVYIQITPVSESQMASFASNELNPPDAVIFSPGLIDGIDALVPIEGMLPVRESLATAGLVNSHVYAAPIAMGGYAWAVNTQWLSTWPLWDLALPAPSRKEEPAYVMQAPADSARLSWSGALLALCMAVPEVESSGHESAPVGDGIDLGLEPELEEELPIEPIASIEGAVFTRPSRLPPNFRADGSVVGDFAAKRAAAIPVTQAEIKRLENLADTGRVPDYEIIPGLGAFTDQLALFAIAQGQSDEDRARGALCRALLDALLEDRAQQDLAAIRALRVTDGAAIYTTNRGMSALEHGYSGREVEVPGAFDLDYVDRKSEALDRVLGD